MSTIEQVIAMLPEEHRQAAFKALTADFEKRFEQRLASTTSVSSPPITSPFHTNSNSSTVLRIKPQSPELFTGNRTKVDQFITQLRRYLLLADLDSIDPIRQVEYAAQYFTGEALVWFETIQKSDTPIGSLNELEIKLRGHFLPYGIEKVARTKLRHLKQTGTVAGYSTLFMQTVIHVPSMHVDDQIDSFVEGLNSNIYKEVVLKDLKTLQEVMDFAVFVESRLQHRHGGFRPGNSKTPNHNYFSSRPSTSTAAPSNTSSTSVPMDLTAVDGTTPPESEVNAIVGPLKKLTDSERDQLRREGKCFRCRNRGHISRDCPKSKNVSAQQ